MHGKVVALFGNIELTGYRNRLIIRIIMAEERYLKKCLSNEILKVKMIAIK